MNHEAARALVMTAWQAAWLTPPALTGFPVEHENLKFKRPDSGPWGRLTLNAGDSTPTAPGSLDTRTPFILVLQVFIPQDQGTRPAYKAADIMARLNGLPFREGDPVTTAVHFYRSSIGPAPKENGLTGFNVTINGYWDSYATN